MKEQAHQTKISGIMMIELTSQLLARKALWCLTAVRPSSRKVLIWAEVVLSSKSKGQRKNALVKPVRRTRPIKRERISNMPVMIMPVAKPIRVGMRTLPSITPSTFSTVSELRLPVMIIPARVERIIGVLKIGTKARAKCQVCFHQPA